MNKKIKIAVILIISNFFFLTSCQNEETTEETKQEHLDIAIQRKNFNEFHELPELVSKHLTGTASESLARGSGTDSLYDFEIDSTSVTQIIKDGKIFYTMAIYREDSTDNSFENLVISNDGAENEAYIIKYFPSAEYFQNLETNIHAHFIGGIEITSLDYSQLMSRGEISCYTVSIAYCGNGSAGTLAGPGCYNHSDGGAHVFTRTYRVCKELPDNPTYISPDVPQSSGGSGSVSTPIVTEPVVLFAERQFVMGLSAEQKLWWNNTLNTDTKKDIIKLLQKNQTQEAEDFAEELINFAIANNNSPEALQEIKNILDILDDGLLGGQPAVVGPDLPITNMAQYLSIFNTSQPATITLYADQPITGSHFPIGPERVGHTFISIKQGTKVRSFGFYPQSTPGSLIPNPATPDPRDFLPTPGVFGNDQGHNFDVSISKQLTANQLLNTINEIVSVFESNPNYNLNSKNCTDLAIDIFESNTNINIPSCESPILWNGQTPATLGEVLRTITLPTGATKNTAGGTAPLNSSN